MRRTGERYHMEWAAVVIIAIAAGILGGILGAGFRVMHLEMAWHHVRADLRKYYTWMRNDRGLSVDANRFVQPATRPELEEFKRQLAQGGRRVGRMD